jgi:rRNA maturation RNase YbeY
MSGTLVLRNRQRVRPVNTQLLRQITLHLLRAEFGVADFEVCVHLVTASEMARLNWEFLQHEGSTDIITFDQSEGFPGNSGIEPPNQMAPPLPSLSPAASGGEGVRRTGEGAIHREDLTGRLAGELFICLDDAVKQAREFRTTWQEELARYVIHGLLHLRGFDDVEPAARRVMKREENRLLRRAGRKFTLAQLQKA